MDQLDPGYLRYVYDGLISGQIHPENPSDLPESLIGLYEEGVWGEGEGGWDKSIDYIF